MRSIPQSVIEEADALIAISLQAELIQALTGLQRDKQCPAVLGGLIQAVRSGQIQKTKGGGTCLK